MLIKEMESVASAREKLGEQLVRFGQQTETVTIREALGRILAEEVVSEINVPDFRRSAMDGYAVRCGDVAGASRENPVRLAMIGEVSMGKAPEFTIGEGQCAYVPTGGMFPEGADGIVIIEDTATGGDIPDAGAGDVEIEIWATAEPGKHLVEVGEDVKAGETILACGTKLRGQEIGVLAALGKAEVSVVRPMTMAILSTGDELVDIGDTPAPGQVRDINSYTQMAIAQKYGMEVVMMELLPDDETVLENAVRKAMEQADIIAMSGGSSVGKKDFTTRIIDKVATPGVFVHGIALKPGKPTILGLDEATRTLFVGVPGHPASAMMSFELVVMEAIKESYGLRSVAESTAVEAVLTADAKAKKSRDTCVTVHLDRDDDGRLTATPTGKKSGAITMMSQADGYILISAGETNQAGDQVAVHLF